MKRTMLAAVAALGLAGVPATAADDPLSPMGFLVGSCWKGAFPGGGTVSDTHCFEAAHGGRFIRDRHIVEGAPGPYSGETLYRWDAAARVIRYAYDASDGGHSDGTARPVEGGLRFEDSYIGPDGKPLAMRASWMRDGPDAYLATTEAQEGGAWKPKFTIRFQRVPQVRAGDRFPDVMDGSFREADGSRVIRLSTRVSRPAAEIWTALSTTEGWRRWAVKAAWVDFRVGGIVETSYDPAATQGSPANIKNQIVAYVPGRMLAIRNVQAPPGFTHAEAFAQTATVIELHPLGAGETEVVLTHAGYRPEPAFDALYTMFLAGDAWTLQNLKTVLERGA